MTYRESRPSGSTAAAPDTAMCISRSVLERLVETVRNRLPRKSFGFLLSEGDPLTVSDFLVFETNIRTSGVWKERFERYGRYFVDHENAGFVTTPEEAWLVQKGIWARGLVEVGVFHSHIRHPANFSGVDFDLHVQRFGALPHLIVSMRNVDLPEVRAFRIAENEVREVALDVRPTSVAPRLSAARTQRVVTSSDAAIRRARRVLALDQRGRPVCSSSKAIVRSIDDLLRTAHAEAIDEIVNRGFLRDAEERYAAHIAPLMVPLDGGSFGMGSTEAKARHFIGELPRHRVELSPFLLSRVAVTRELFGLFDPDRGSLAQRDRSTPAINMTWYEATAFALWMGCRLPTEAEWEHACGAGSAGEWCCSHESELSRYAWYSENAGSETHPVATRDPNAFGLFDLHGNVWEWCQDVYDPGYYARAAAKDPVCRSLTPDQADSSHRVSRGGCMYSFAEMCRTRYRFHEAPTFYAADLGFRLARSDTQQLCTTSINGEQPWSH